MRLFANFFLKTKVRNEIIPSKNQYPNIPPFHYPIWPTWNMFHIKILLFQQVIEIPIHNECSENIIPLRLRGKLRGECHRREEGRTYQTWFGVICCKPPNSCEFDSNGIRLMAMVRETKKLNFEPLAISYYVFVIFSFLYALCLISVELLLCPANPD